ncbi:hypothetical protein [Sphingomonas lenta]|uniref:Uncharacterized protein n=1 Tax=Sphingomonas lenta TaxID=1141887 RepID=A0A2A2SE60_9SPHN|nr:hypothetical protein [Sphingomonas lenta]PAX07472.1 hypothetical protein CKY28_07340 [Sphingomonas lenta]
MKTLLRPMLVLAFAGLAACSNSGEEAEAPKNTAEVVQEVPAPVEEPTPVETTAPPPAETTAEANVAVPDTAEPSADEQMLDDASATGMTSRSARDEQAEELSTANSEAN